MPLTAGLSMSVPAAAEMFFVSGAPSMGSDSLSTLAPESEPNRLTASAAAATTTTKTSEATTVVEREGRPGTGADRIARTWFVRRVLRLAHGRRHHCGVSDRVIAR